MLLLWAALPATSKGLQPSFAGYALIVIRTATTAYVGSIPLGLCLNNSDKQRINTGNSLLPHLRQQAEVPEGLVMTIMLIFASLASLGHVFRQLSILWHLSFLDIIVKICAYGDDDVTGLTLQSSEASLRLHRGVNVAAVV